MTLGLATRGYLCSTTPREGELGPFGPGPTIISTTPAVPVVDGSVLEQDEGPSVTGAVLQGPQITSGTSPQADQPGESPTIDGAGVLSPGITGGKED